MKNMREIKFRGKRIDNGEWVYGGYHTCIREATIRKFEYGKSEATIEKHNLDKHWILTHQTPDSMGWTIHDTFRAYSVTPESVGQFTGLHDKNGKEIYEGDVVRWRNPYRTTQTHTGDNIPNGSYTEPMEPGIITHQCEVIFKEGCFGVEEEKRGIDQFVPFAWGFPPIEYTLSDVKEAISYGRSDRFIWDDPEEGDLQYLIEECAKVKTPDELLEYINVFEVISNIYETPELITTPTGA